MVRMQLIMCSTASTISAKHCFVPLIRHWRKGMTIYPGSEDGERVTNAEISVRSSHGLKTIDTATSKAS